MNFRDFAEQEKSFKNILMEEEPSSVTNVFLLKKYIERYGITEKLLNYFGIASSMVQDICNHCYDNMLVPYIVNNPSLIEKCKNETEYKHKCEERISALFDFCELNMKSIRGFLDKQKDENDTTAELFLLLLLIVFDDFREYDYMNALKTRGKNINLVISFCNDNDLDYTLQKNGDLIVYLWFPFIDRILISKNLLQDSFSISDVEYLISTVYFKEISDLKNEPRYYSMLGYIMNTCPMIDEDEKGNRVYVYNGKRIHAECSIIDGWPVYSTKDIYGFMHPWF